MLRWICSLVFLSWVVVAQVPAPPSAPLDLGAPPADAVRHPSGLVSKVLKPGTGQERPADNGMVIVHFSGWSADGKNFGHTWNAEVTPHLLMEVLMPGMREGLGHMVAGEARRLWIPEALAFKGAPGKPKGQVVMDVELFEVQPHPAQAPPDVAAPPPDAQVRPSGLAWKRLRPGTGKVHPNQGSIIQVHYTGWTTDGKMFDSSIARRDTALLKMTEVIPGWVEGLQLMVTGERCRFWIPKRLAYNGEKDKPAGMLVFDIELLTLAK